MYSRSLVSNTCTIRILSNHLLGTCIVSLVFDLPFCDWRWVVIVYAYRRDSNSTHTARHRRRLRSKHMPALWASVAGTRPERAVHSLQEKHFVQVWQFCPTHFSSSRDYFSAKSFYVYVFTDSKIDVVTYDDMQLWLCTYVCNSINLPLTVPVQQKLEWKKTHRPFTDSRYIWDQIVSDW